MQISTAFEMVQRDQTVAGDILQIRGAWALRLEGGYLLYLNGLFEGLAELAGPKLCLRLKGYKGIAVDFAGALDATTADVESPNPLVHIAAGFALYASYEDKARLFDFAGKEIDSVPYIKAGPWIATVYHNNGSELRLF